MHTTSLFYFIYNALYQHYIEIFIGANILFVLKRIAVLLIGRKISPPQKTCLQSSQRNDTASEQVQKHPGKETAGLIARV